MEQNRSNTQNVEEQYSRERLFEAIMEALRLNGVTEDTITRKDLSGVDEFHVRGMEVTQELAAQAGLSAGARVLDAGCGLGGPARFLADQYGCYVTGIDITREYVRTATLLSQRTGLANKTRFIHGTVRQLPFADGAFDAVWTQHVQMNIANKKQFYAELARVLRPGGLLAYYDIFSVGHKPVYFPVPWADSPGISHLITLQECHHLLHEAGFVPSQTTDQSEKAMQFFENLFQKMKEGTMRPVSLKLLMGDAIGDKQGNLYKNLAEKRITLESGICRKSGETGTL